MPKKDPVTGVPVLTTKELYDQLAKTEGNGKTGTQLFQEDLSEMARAEEEQRQSYYKPEVAKQVLNEAIKEWNSYDEEKLQEVGQVTKVLSVAYSETFRLTKLNLKANAIDVNGKEGIIALNSHSFSGTRLDPPDEEPEEYWE